MSPVKIRILVSGLLVLCLLSLFWTDYGDRVIGLTELVAASGAWACAVWLWNESSARRFGAKISSQTRAVALIIWAVISRLALYAMYLTVPVMMLMMALEIGPWSKESNVNWDTIIPLILTCLFLGLIGTAIDTIRDKMKGPEYRKPVPQKPILPNDRRNTKPRPSPPQDR
jgi:hypothetical protein